MGRRPNAIVNEYFVRGQKLDDSSNRYAQTCKRCGEYFPKGRVDNLTSHLLRRCPNLSSDDRQRVFESTQQQAAALRHALSETNQVPVSPSDPQTSLGPLHIVRYEISSQSDRNGPSSPVLPNREQSALDTLAEVSRRHLDYSATQSHNGDEVRCNELDSDREIAEQALLMQLQQATALHSDPSSQPKIPDIQTHVQCQHPEPDDVAMSDAAPTPDVAAAAVSLRTKHLEPPSARDQTPLNTESLFKEGQSAIERDHTVLRPRPTSESASLLWTPTSLPSAHSHINSEDAADVTTGFGLLHQTPKNRARGRFNDVRRKEVQEIRRRGACIRCRMLKKPCSEDTPCNTCRGVESARLWKNSCLRTRLAEVFTLWSMNLFHSRAKTNLPSDINRLQHSATGGQLKVRCFTATDQCMTFAGRKYNQIPAYFDASIDNFHPGSRHGAALQSPVQHNPESEVWLLVEGEATSQKVEEYTHQAADACIAGESSPFLQATLLRAQERIRMMAAEQTSAAAQSTRSCYNLQDHLLNNVVELWVGTCILVGVASATFDVRSISPSSTYIDSEHDKSSNGYEPVSKRSAELIHAQVLAAVEARCSKLSKTITNELERRLLQRQQGSRFDTFLSATILLSCIERMTGFFRGQDTSNSIAEQDPPGKDATLPPQPPDWPLDVPPHQLWPQGERFANLLSMLLRIRALPPPTTTLPDGRLVVGQPSSHAAQGRQSSKPESQAQIDLAAEWLDPVGLQMDDLIRIRDRAVPGPGEGIHAWDLRFIAGTLLSEKRA